MSNFSIIEKLTILHEKIGLKMSNFKNDLKWPQMASSDLGGHL